VTAPAAAHGRFPRLRRLVERIGPFSPFVTGGTFTPAARRLLAQAEGGAERVLHCLRLLVFAVATGLGLFAFGIVELVPAWWPFFVAVIAGFVALWAIVWRRLERDGGGIVLRAGLIVFDAFAIDRGVLLFQNPGGLYSWLAPDLHRAMLRLFQPADVEAITPPMLVLLALTGALRLDPRLALVSTGAALAVYVHLRVVFPLSAAQTWITGLVILGAGLLGANAARVFRFVAWKASQEQVLERYVTPALTDELARSGDPERSGRLETVTVLVADIRGFTTLAERAAPATAVALLNACFETIVAPITCAGGVVDKYVGDGLLAFFEGPDHASRALAAGRDMLAALVAFNAVRSEGDALRIGIAVHAGEALVGTVGAAGRRDYTVIGDVVNVAARLEEANKRLGSCLIVSEPTAALVGDPRALDALAGPVAVELRGREASVPARYLPGEGLRSKSA
jgi:adenylate cyclase